jgi:hypothetical protein
MKTAYLFDEKTRKPSGIQQCQTCQITGKVMRPFNSLPVPPPTYTDCIVVRAGVDGWVVDLYASKESALAEVDKLHAETLRKLTGNATTEERDTWAPKAMAARAVLADTADATQTAMIGLEAEVRGVPVKALAQKVLENAAAFELLVGKAAAFRAKSRKVINESADVDALDAGLKQLMAEMSDAAKRATP